MTEATAPRATCPPLGVSIWSCRRLARSCRVPEVLQAATVVSTPPEEISDIGSLAIMIAAARLITPGVSP